MEIGSVVEWTQVSSRGRGFSLKQRTGKVVEINGDIVAVKAGGGKIRNFKKEDLHVCGSGPNQLSRLITAMAGGQ